MTQVQVGEMMNQLPQSIGQKINVRESVRADEFFDILNKMGIDIMFYVRKTGEVLMKDPKKHGRQVVGMSDGIMYNTNEGTLLASSFYADGVNEYGLDGKAQELYIDKKGRYFVAEYSNEETDKGRVRSVPEFMANAFIKQYGVDDTKTPV